MTEKPIFKIGEEAISRITGERGYIVNSFRACVVNFKKTARVIPEQNLTLEEPLSFVERKLTRKDNDFFVRGDIVRVIPTEKTVIIGTVVDSKWFYIFHLHKTGELKVVLADMLAKGNLKIIPFINIPTIKLKDLPGQGKMFRGK